MSNFIIGPGSPCSECGEVYGQHRPNCPQHVDNRPPSLTRRIEALATDGRPVGLKFQSLIYLVAELAREVEGQ